jgi:hypothetical protein
MTSHKPPHNASTYSFEIREGLLNLTSLFDCRISEVDLGFKFLKIIVMIVRPLLFKAWTATTEILEL